jgi:hypothetical protein
MANASHFVPVRVRDIDQIDGITLLVEIESEVAIGGPDIGNWEIALCLKNIAILLR